MVAITKLVICKHSDPRSSKWHVFSIVLARSRCVAAGPSWPAWLVALGVMAALSLSFAGEFTGNFSIPGTESQQANDLIQAKTPGADADAPSGRVVFAAPAGQTLASGAGRAAVERTVGAIERVPGVASASNPRRSPRTDDRLHQRGLLAPGGDGRVAAGRHRAGIRGRARGGAAGRVRRRRRRRRTGRRGGLPDRRTARRQRRHPRAGDHLRLDDRGRTAAPHRPARRQLRDPRHHAGHLGHAAEQTSRSPWR